MDQMDLQEKSPAPILSVVVPLYNEKESIRPLTEAIVKSVSKIGEPFEVIYVDDGSTDGSDLILREVCLHYPMVTAIRFRRNFGQTAAMSAGFDHAQGAIIIAMDGDLQNDPEDIPKLLKKMEEGYDIVNGWRRDRQDRKFTKVLPSKIANWLIGRTTGVKLHDYGCSLKAYRADVIKNIPLYGELHRFIPALASIYGAQITEIPVTHHARKFGRSKYTLSKTSRVLIDLILVLFLKTFSHRPFQLFGMFGLLLFLAGFVIDGMLAIEKIIWGAQLANRPLLLLGTVFILAGLQIFSLGILAEIQIRTYYESQKKPIYSIKEIIH